MINTLSLSELKEKIKDLPCSRLNTYNKRFSPKIENEICINKSLKT
jgi:hypothetical protein